VEYALDRGVEIVLWLQQFSPALDFLFIAFTFLGDQEFFMLLLPFYYWCVDRRRGARLIILFLLSAYVNLAAKHFFDQPRPFEYDPRVHPIVPASGGGLPSGHTQNTVVVWGYLAFVGRHPALWLLASVLIVGVPLSRVYLGVHFPTDLAGGYVLGIALLGLYTWLAAPVERWFARCSFGRRMLLAVLLPALAAAGAPGSDPGAWSACGTFTGMAVGFLLERRWIRFQSEGDWWKRLLRFVLGLAVLFFIYAGLQRAFAAMEPMLFFRFVRYAAVGLWGALGAPWLFIRLRLAGRAAEGHETTP
jgi:membrane-associated phospholipid phosphatase